VAVLGSGGLSHHVPLPSWPELDPDDEESYQTFVTGLTDEQLRHIEPKRVERVLAFINSPHALINQALDRRFLAGLEAGSLDSVLSCGEDDLTSAGGSGMHEIRNWAAAFGAAGATGGQTVGYAPVPNWVTGMGVMRFSR
jgi:2,3-dihydroxyphenylpropionate 1,2-dioxygenase